MKTSATAAPLARDDPTAGPLYRDRAEAGRLLGDRLAAYAGADTLVVGIAHGGVPVAAEVARSLRADLDVVVVRKLVAPQKRDVAIGAVSSTGAHVLDEELVADMEVRQGYISREVEGQAALARETARRLRGDRGSPLITGRVVLVVDDALVTGMSARAAALAVLGARPRKVIVAVPVGADEGCASAASEADEVICLAARETLLSSDEHYERRGDVTDAALNAIVRQAPLILL